MIRADDGAKLSQIQLVDVGTYMHAHKVAHGHRVPKMARVVREIDHLPAGEYADRG